MRAIYIKKYGPIDSHSVVDLPDPEPGPGEVLVKNYAIGLNYPDALMLLGKYQKRPEPPFVPGRDFAGVVLAVGEGVTRCKPGDRIAAQVFRGGFAELVAAPERRCFVMPHSMDFASAAAMLTGFNTTYVICVIRGKVKAGETVLVTGAAGGVGLSCVQFCKAYGATVIAAVSTPEKAELAKANGADHIIYTNVDDIKATFKKRVTEITGEEKGCEMAIDTIGGDVFTACTRILKFEGRVLVVGFSGGKIGAAPTHYLLYNNLSVIGAPIDVHFDHRYEQIVEGVKVWFNLYEQGKIRPNIMVTYPLEEFKQAFDLIVGRKVRGKIVLTTQPKIRSED